jgi:hypothetical protein
MEQIFEFFSHLFDVSDWPPRWFCGKWSDFHGWLYIFSDLTIWLAYFAIPVILIWFIQRNRNMPFLPVFWLFVAFILFCGSTHAIDALIFWWPAYRLSALLRFATALASILTVFALIRDLPKALDMKNKKSVSSGGGDHEKLIELEAKYETALDKLAQKEKEIALLTSQLKQGD